MLSVSFALIIIIPLKNLQELHNSIWNKRDMESKLKMHSDLEKILIKLMLILLLYQIRILK